MTMIARDTVASSLDVANYIADITSQLEAVAVAAHLDLLAYFLGMAKAESDLIFRSGAVEAENGEWVQLH